MFTPENPAARRAVAPAHRAIETTTPEEISVTTINHHSHARPTCQDCGDTRGPWRPTGEHCEHDIQLFRCVRCADRDAEADRAAQARAQAEIVAARAEEFERVVTDRAAVAVVESGRPVLELAAETGISIHRWAALFDGRECWTVGELFKLANAIGADTTEWFRPAAADR